MTTHQSPLTADNKDIVLAFSGGLDTSFCIPWLKERGWAVHTVFADTGGVDAEERAYIEARAAELGVASHVTVDGGPALLVRAVGQGRQAVQRGASARRRQNCGDAVEA